MAWFGKGSQQRTRHASSMSIMQLDKPVFALPCGWNYSVLFIQYDWSGTISALTGRAAATNFNKVHEIGVHGNQELSSFVAPGLRPTSAKVLYRQSVQLAVGIRNHQAANMPRMLEHPQGGSMCTIYAQCAVTFFDFG